ncbi:tyrosinase family oxidase copper chaperone [Streptomyces sp. NPDC057376]|uniref:tyrosinase family oxidase copper chaperone n=1 Tax=unclassified Streptomyces TaxID=2593676 RepID=UPI0009A0B237
MGANADRTVDGTADGPADGPAYGTPRRPVSGAEGGAGRTAAGPAAGAPAVLGTRRQMMRGLLAPALAVSLAPLVAASRPARPAATGSDARPARPEPHVDAHVPAEGTSFDETYRGRRIRGIRSAAGRAVGAGTWHVTVDGRPLHLMRRADGSWLSMIDHYRSYPTPLAAARGAVDELGPGEHLRDTPAAAGHGHHPGGRHGVHA